MEVEVSTLMGVADEAHWNKVGLFSSVDELSVGTCSNPTIVPSINPTTMTSAELHSQLNTVTGFA